MVFEIFENLRQTVRYYSFFCYLIIRKKKQFFVVSLIGMIFFQKITKKRELVNFIKIF